MTISKRIAQVHRGRFVVKFYSRKNNCSLTLESFQELKKAYQLECDPTIRAYAAQPEQVEIYTDKKKQCYTPDFLVLYHSGFAEYIEVHHKSLIDADYRERIRSFDAYTRKTLGVGIKLISVDKLHSVHMANLALLAQYATSHQVTPSVAPQGEMTLGELIECLKELPGCEIAHAYGLLAANEFIFNYFEPLTKHTLLTRVEHI